MTTPAADSRAENTRRRLVAAGLELFGRLGFDGVTTRQLAEAAGVNQAAIPYHFGGKQGVYLAVADHVAEEVGQRVDPLINLVHRRLADGPPPEVVRELLLDVTLALARAAFEPDHRRVWFAFLTREQFHPSAAFERLYARVSGPASQVVTELIGALLGKTADAQETIFLAHAYLGQIIGFVSARATLNRRLGRGGDSGAEDAEPALAAIERLSRCAMDGMTKAAAEPSPFRS